jgi:hypothetical protein
VRTKNKDSIEGKRPDYDYDILESKTDAVIHKAEFAISYSTTDLFMKKKFPVPLKIGSTFSRVVSGINTERVNQLSLDFEMYF